MGVTNFDIIKANQYLGIPTASDSQSDTGAVFYVNNSSTGLLPGAVGGSDSNDGKSPLTPFSTLDYAIGQCTANRGDTIYVLPGHAESVASAGAIACDVAGIEIIGIGNGNSRPTFTFGTATTASMTVSANNVKIKNIVGVAGIDALANPINVTGDGVEIDMEWQDGSSAIEAARAILLTGSDRANIRLKYIGFTAGDAVVNAIRIVNCRDCRIYIDSYGVCTTAWVEFLTTASINVRVDGIMYTSGITNFSRDVVDTVTGTTWSAEIFDASAGARISGGSGAALASDDVSSVASTVSTISSTLAVPTADVTTNTNERDVIGNKTDASVYVPGTTKSLAAYAKGTLDLEEKVAKKTAAVLTNGQTLFTIAGGPIQIIGLTSICETGNDATASTLQYNVTPTSGSAQTISAASASLANATAGASVTLAGTALSTAALYNANGPNLIANPGTIMAPAGTLTAVVGVGSTTGTWAHYIRYKPLATGVTVS